MSSLTLHVLFYKLEILKPHYSKLLCSRTGYKQQVVHMQVILTSEKNDIIWLVFFAQMEREKKNSRSAAVGGFICIMCAVCTKIHHLPPEIQVIYCRSLHGLYYSSLFVEKHSDMISIYFCTYSLIRRDMMLTFWKELNYIRLTQ